MQLDSVLVTGANRGIGLGIVKHLIASSNPPKHIFASYRSDDSLEVIKQLQNVTSATQIHPLKLDVTNEGDIKGVRESIQKVVGERGLNLLVNNAALLRFEKFPDVTEESMMLHFKNNTVANVKVMQELYPLLKKAAISHQSSGMSIYRAAVINISSIGGSCGKLDEPQPDDWLGALSYRTSKAALNMAMKVIALTIKDEGVLVVQMCPGWVKTDMGSDAALLTVDESVSAMLDTWTRLNETHHGHFIDKDGKRIPY